MKKSLAVVGLLAITGVGYMVIQPQLTFAPDSELAQQREWSVLQGVEARHRAAPNQNSMLLIRNALDTEYALLGLPLTTGTGYAWVVLNPDSKPTVKVMPADANFVVTQQELTVLTKEYAWHPEVVAFLASRAQR